MPCQTMPRKQKEKEHLRLTSIRYSLCVRAPQLSSPPTPICSPGLESLTAVCEPTQTEDMFFYFYPDADGNMQAAFSKTYEEHQQAIADNSNAGGADGSGDAAAGEGAAA